MISEKGKICVFAASSKNAGDVFMGQASKLGQLMASRGWDCIQGGGSTGLMRAVADAMLEHGGHVTGVIPKFMVDNGWLNPRLTDVIITADMHQRKEMMIQQARAIVALPGGLGTLEELLEVLTWRQLGLITMPVVLLNTAGFFEPLNALLMRCIECRFMSETHNLLWALAATPVEALDIVERQLSEGVPLTEKKN